MPHSVPSDQCIPVADFQSAIDLGCITDTDDEVNPVPNGKPVCQYESSDPDGDGWGWENNQSCVVGGTENKKPTKKPGSVHPECESASSDPDGDGWGWENMASCRVS